MRVVNYTEPVIVDKFLTHDECDYLINANGRYGPSVIGSGEHSQVNKSIRNCDQKIFLDKIDNKLLSNVCVQIEKYLPNTKYTVEPLSVLRYKSSEYYRPHQDSSDYDKRHFTFVIALNDSYEGGETEFPNLKREYKLKKGQALFFHNRDNDGNMTHYSYHGGKKVNSGKKWICNLWITVDFEPCRG